MANCTITGTVFWNTLPKAGVTVYARIEKTGEVQFTEAQRVATSDVAGLVTFDLPQSCIAYIEGEFQCGATNFNVQGGVALTIPAAASATLESLSAAVTFPPTGVTVEDDGVALTHPVSIFDYGTGLTVTEVSPGRALIDAAGGGSYSDADADARIALAVGVTVQAFDADLVTLASSITAFGLSLVDDANAAAGRTTLELSSAHTPTFTGVDLTGNLRLTSDAGEIQLGASSNVALAWDAANVLAQRRTTNPQMFRVYNTFTNASNYERAEFGYVSNQLRIGTFMAGTGANRDVVFYRAGVAHGLLLGTQWRFSVPIDFTTDNVSDIGTSGANRPRHVYVGSDVIAGGAMTATAAVVTGATGFLRVLTRLNLSAPSDGVGLLQNAAVNDFGRLQFGGTTAAFPALKRSGTVLQHRTASDSAYAECDALEYRASGTKVIGAQGAAVIDATDNPTAITQLNALLARLRTHGLIAT